MIPPKANFPPWRARRPAEGLAGVCHPAPAFLVGLRLPPTCPGAPNPPSTSAVVRSGFRHPAAALDAGWVGGPAAGGAGPPHPLWERQRRKGTELNQGESSGMQRVAAGAEKCNPFGSHLYSRRRPGETALWGNLPASPSRACVPLRWPPDHCHSQRGALGPAAARATLPGGGPEKRGSGGLPAEGRAPASPVE